MTFHDSAMFILAHKPSHDLELFFTVAWAIWYNRNRVTHEDKCSSPSQVWQMAKSSIEDFNDAATIDLSTPRLIHHLVSSRLMRMGLHQTLRGPLA